MIFQCPRTINHSTTMQKHALDDQDGMMSNAYVLILKYGWYYNIELKIISIFIYELYKKHPMVIKTI